MRMQRSFVTNVQFVREVVGPSVIWSNIVKLGGRYTPWYWRSEVNIANFLVDGSPLKPRGRMCACFDIVYTLTQDSKCFVVLFEDFSNCETRRVGAHNVWLLRVW